jgi:serine/threonine protein kinase
MSSYLPNGTILDHNFRIIETIGQGGFGITYKAENISLGNIVCIKELFISGNSTRGVNNTVHSQNMKENSFNHFKERFITEARDLAKFNNPGIVKVLGVFEQNDTAYFVMDFVEGETLKSYVSKNGRLTLLKALPIMEGLMNALEYVHNKGMLHRDIKPDNVLVDKDGNVVLIDFGSARQFTEGYTVTHTSMITPGYAPLEQYDERVKRGVFTDIYSLGATMYFLLTGQKPIPATSRGLETLAAPHHLFTDISVSLSSAVMLAMNLKPEERFQTIVEMRKALQSQKEDPAPEPKPDVPEEEVSKPRRTYLVLGIVIVVYIITTAVIFGTKTSENSIPEVSIPAISTDSTIEDNVNIEEPTNFDQQISAEEQAILDAQSKEVERLNEEERVKAEESAKRIERIKREEQLQKEERVNIEVQKRTKKTTELHSPIIGSASKLNYLNIEITQFDFPYSMTWDQAIDACAKLGYGWRLPTKNELNSIYSFNSDKFFGNRFYWSSTEYDNGSAWGIYTGTGAQIGYNKGNKFYGRAVRSF